MGWWTRRLIPLVVGVVVIVVGVVWHAQDEDLDGAEDAVRAYVALIAKGDASAANATVDPSRSDKIDPRLLTDKVLGAASKHIEVREVAARPDWVSVVQPAGRMVVLPARQMAVEVRYRLDGKQHEVILVAQRDDGVLGFGRQWRVITPLTVPVSIGSNREGIGQARIGSVPVPTVEGVEEEDKHLHVYPGRYTITADPSTYFTAKGYTLPLAVDSVDPLPQPDVQALVILEYHPNERMRRDAGKLAIDLLHACLADSPDVIDCPYPTQFDATDVRLTAKPVVSIDEFPVYPIGQRDPAPGQVLVEFPVTYTNSAGKQQSEKRTLYKKIHIDENQTLRIDYYD